METCAVTTASYGASERLSGEAYLDYMVRLFEHKQEYGLTCNDIADLLNEQTGNSYSECTYRKYYAAFNDGRTYERSGVAAMGGEQAEAVTSILCLSDFHYPYAAPLETFQAYRRPDVLLLNGDIVDMQSISRFPKSYRVNPMEEMIGGRQYLIDLIEYLAPRRVLINKGNHEVRFGSYLARSLDGELKDLMPETALDLIVNDGFHHYDKRTRTKIWYQPIRDVFEGVDISYTGDWWCKLGKTIFAHPLAYSGGILKTSEKAANHFLRMDPDFDALVLAHTHKLGMYREGNITLFEQGCCCLTEKMDYADGKLTMPQQKGFLYLCQDGEGRLLFDRTRLVMF